MVDVFMFAIPDDKDFREYKDMTVIETTHGSLQLHIPAAVKKSLNLKGGEKMTCFANKNSKEILYRLVRDEDNEQQG